MRFAPETLRSQHREQRDCDAMDGGDALAVLAVLWGIGRPVNVTEAPPAAGHPSTAARTIAMVGFGIAVVLYIVAWILFLGFRKWFSDNAHPISAITMFVFIFLAVLENAINFRFIRKEVVAQQAAAGPTTRTRQMHSRLRTG